jgi:hypothetical protein
MKIAGRESRRVREAVWADGIHVWVAGVLLFCGVGLRLLLNALGWPQTNSDESTMGLMALHIASGRDYPGFFYGQNYMGALQAYIAAPLFRLFGPSIFVLRLSMVLLCTVFLINMYWLTRRLYTKKLALITLAMLNLGTPETLFTQLTSTGGYGEVLCFGSGLLLIASWLALSSGPDSEVNSWRRVLGFGAWGLAAGVSLWSDLLLLPFVGMAGLLLIIWCRRELRQWRVSGVLVLAFLVGALPLIAYNLRAVPGQDSLSVLMGLHQGGGSSNASPIVALGGQIAGTLIVSLPNVTEANPICSLGPRAVWPLTSQASGQTLLCTVVRTGWGLAAIALWVVAAVLALATLGAIQRVSEADGWSTDDRRCAVVQTARLALLGSAGGTLALFALSTAAARVPWPATRYLIGLLVAFPAGLATLWPESYPFKLLPRAARFARPLWASRYIVLAPLALTLMVGVSDTFQLVRGAQRLTREESALIGDLLHIGATHVYTDYWTCNRIAFQSKERIVCGVLDEHLQPGMNRYRPYYDAVRADAHAAYVFPLDSPQAAAFAAKQDASQGYRRLTFDRYVVYQRL